MRRLPFAFLLPLILSGCFSVSVSRRYEGPPERPAELLSYYNVGNSYDSFTEELVKENIDFTQKKIVLNSSFGTTTVDFYQRKSEPDDRLILVFPLLGGSNKIADYFAEYFAQRGFDTAIVSRNNDFKDPALFRQLEEILRSNVIRDRIAIDFFEKHYGKHDFGSFGISRGAINVALTAGVDARLKHNVLALGATDIIRIMKTSNEKRIEKYRNQVIEKFGITEKEFNTFLTDTIKTDPKQLAKYLDARHTLLFLALLDKTVPIQYGVKLRQEIGGPRTVYLLADHYLSAGFTQLAAVAAPGVKKVGFPFDYIEQEALDFYRTSFDVPNRRMPRKLVPFRIMQAPLSLVANIFDSIF